MHVGQPFDSIGDHLPARTVILTDENVKRHWAQEFEGDPTIVLPAGEEQKSLAVVEDVVNQLVAIGADRNSFLLGVGGGVICDLTGFIASVFMRGIPFGFVPTTLLAQIDAAIGGKNGVNSGPFKNMIGLFNQPEFILSDHRFLTTLSDVEFANGLAEAIKHACIANAEYFAWIETHLDKIVARDSEILHEFILESVRIKCTIVEADPLEKNERRLLNYGHTFGHAIEKTLNIPHGQAVSLGMVMANALAVEKGFLDVAQAQRIAHLLDRAGLPVDVSALDKAMLQKLIRSDKKKVDDSIAFVLLNAIGRASIEMIPLDDD